MKYLINEASILLNEENLDPKFFDNDNNLNQNIREVLLDVLEDMLAGLKKKGFDLDSEFVYLTGSLTGYNWDEASDVDFHIGVDFKKFTNIERSRSFLQLFARDFNAKKFHLARRSLELYFQDIDEPNDSPGIYDILGDHWIKVPEGIRIDKTKEMKDAAEKYRIEVDNLVKSYGLMPKSRETISGFQEILSKYFENIRTMRKNGITQEGRAGFGNQVFKMLRRNNTLEMLTSLIAKVQDNYYDVEWD